MTEELKPCPFCGGEAFIDECCGNPCSVFVTCCLCNFAILRPATNEGCNKEMDHVREQAAKWWNTRVNDQTALQWTKEPPTEKDAGRLFALRYTHRKGGGDQQDYGEVAQFGHESLCLARDGYEFLGPLPE